MVPDVMLHKEHHTLLLPKMVNLNLLTESIGAYFYLQKIWEKETNEVMPQGKKPRHIHNKKYITGQINDMKRV